MHRVPRVPDELVRWGGVPRGHGPAFSFQALAPVERKLIHPRYEFYRARLQRLGRWDLFVIS